MHSEGPPSTQERATGATADVVVLSYPDVLSARTVNRIGQSYYRTYLAKTLGRVTVGDAIEEFTDVGCCGSQIDVSLRVEAIDGDRSGGAAGAVGRATTIEYEERETDGEAACRWDVQNERERGEGGVR